ncbi:hypothetical protein Emag_007459 [Eimeria magna]
MVAILIHAVAPGKPEDYLHQTLALIARRPHTQSSRLHMQFTEAYDACRDICTLPRSPPHLCEHFVVTAFSGNLPKNIARDTRNQVSAADHPNDLQCVARLAITFDTLARTYPGKGEQRPRTTTPSPSTTTSARLLHPQSSRPRHTQLCRARKPRRRCAVSNGQRPHRVSCSRPPRQQLGQHPCTTRTSRHRAPPFLQLPDVAQLR